MTTSTQNSDFLAAYLAVGDDTLKREAVRKRLRSRLEKVGDISFNCDEFDGETAHGKTIVEACNTLPFASPIRLVEIFHVEKLRKADAEAVIDYLKKPNPSTVLLMTAEKLASNTRLYKAIAAFGKNAIITCSIPKKKDLPALVRSMAVNHGVTIGNDAAIALVDRVGEDTVALDSEIAKLALSHQGSTPISSQEVRDQVALTAEIKPWEFVDAFTERSLSRCLSLLPMIKSTTPVGILGLCTARIRDLLCAQSLDHRGYGSTSALANALGKTEWQVKSIYSAKRVYSQQELISALRLSRNTELAMKTGTDPDAALVEWLGRVISKSGR